MDSLKVFNKDMCFTTYYFCHMNIRSMDIRTIYYYYYYYYYYYNNNNNNNNKMIKNNNNNK